MEIELVLSKVGKELRNNATKKELALVNDPTQVTSQYFVNEYESLTVPSQPDGNASRRVRAGSDEDGSHQPQG